MNRSCFFVLQCLIPSGFLDAFSLLRMFLFFNHSSVRCRSLYGFLCAKLLQGVFTKNQ